MFIRRWIIAVALGLVLSTSLKAQDEAQSVEDGASGQQQPTLVLPITIPVQIIEDDERASSRERREAETEQREKDALIAQQGMNTATQAMNEATQSMKKAAWWSFGAVVASGFLLFYNLMLIQTANKTAMDAVRVTTSIGQAQTRSYLYLVSIDAKIVDGVITGMVQIGNSGTSPALSVKEILSFNYSKQGFEEQWFGSPPLTSAGNLHSKETAKFLFSTAGEDVPATDIGQGHVNFWVFGRVEYVDVFNQKWRLDYRHQYHRNHRNGRYSFIKCAEGNSLNKID
jgi:hypothetical protein